MTTYAYVSNADSKDITVLRLDPQNGEHSPVETVTVSTAGPAQTGTMPLAISPDRRFLHAALRFGPYTGATFSIDPRTGRLRPIGTAALPDSLAYIATDRSGRHLLGASYSGNKLSVSAIDPEGRLTANATIVPTGKNAHMVLSDPGNRFVFATNLGSDAVVRGRFDPATGAISDVALTAVTTKTGAGPRHFRFHPNGRYLYLINELDASLNAYCFDSATGALSEIQSVSNLPPGFTDKPWAADLHLTPDGRFLYGSERKSSTIAGFAVDGASGRLTPIGSAETETQPRGFAIDPSGRYLLAAGQISNALSVHAIEPQTGALRRLKQYKTGLNPSWLEIVELP